MRSKSWSLSGLWGNPHLAPHLISLGVWLRASVLKLAARDLQPLSFPTAQYPPPPVHYPGVTSPPAIIPQTSEPHSLRICNDGRLPPPAGIGPETPLTWPFNTSSLVITRQTRPKRGSSDLAVLFQCRNHIFSPRPYPKLRD